MKKENTTQAKETKFRDYLSRRSHFAGWSGAPWQDSASADRFATRVANQYIERFTEELMKMGVLPYTGVEVNYSLEGIDPEQMIEYIKSRTVYAQEAHIYFTTAAKYAHYIRNNAFPVPELPEAEDAPFMELAQMQEDRATLLQMVQDIQRHCLIDEGQRRELRHILEADIAEYIDPEFLEALRGYCKAFVRFDSNTQRVGSLMMNSDDRGEFTGRIYNDQSQVEIATPPKRPIATVHHVNALKTTIFEASHEFEQTYRDLAKSGDPDDQPARSRLAQRVRDDHDAFNVHIVHSHKDTKTDELVTMNSGEHLSISLLHAKGRNYIDVGAATEEDGTGAQRYIFSQDNLFAKKSIRDLYQKAFERFLPDSSLLGLGNVLPLTDYRCEKIHVRPHFHQHVTDRESSPLPRTQPEASRLEIRSFNNASSNLSLSMLAVLAITYAVTREIHEHPHLSFLEDKAMVYATDVDEVIESLCTKYRTNEKIPADLEDAEQAFLNHSIVPQMMRQFVEDHAKNDDEKIEMLKEIAKFEEAVTHRLRKIEQDHAVGL